jgi:phosphoribosylamine--glycine ligase
MGAYSPAPVVTGELAEQVMERIMYPMVRAMAEEGRPYKGVLYAGLMIRDNVARVVEFNCRLGDPEAQPLLMRLRTDLVDIIEAVIDERLDRISLDIDPRPAVCVVMAAEGYPGSYRKGMAIRGLDRAALHEDVEVFHAGTARKNKQVVSSGGRVLGVTALGGDLRQAIDKAYGAVAEIDWPGCYFRKDIGYKALQRAGEGGAAAPVRQPLVGIVMGSDSDLPVMQGAADFLEFMGIPYEMTIASAHRTPAKAAAFASSAAERGLKVIIAGAGMAAHLAGVLAAHTDLPLIGVPIDASPLNGLDALLATVQMPPGIPVATMAIGKAGAKNGAVLATRILALEDEEIAARLVAFRQGMAEEVEAKDRQLRDQRSTA